MVSLGKSRAQSSNTSTAASIPRSLVHPRNHASVTWVWLNESVSLDCESRKYSRHGGTTPARSQTSQSSNPASRSNVGRPSNNNRSLSADAPRSAAKALPYIATSLRRSLLYVELARCNSLIRARISQFCVRVATSAPTTRLSAIAADGWPLLRLSWRNLGERRSRISRYRLARRIVGSRNRYARESLRNPF